MHDELTCGDMTWLCMAGNCEGCYLRSVCDQPCPYIDGHLDEVIEATCAQFRRCVEEISAHMEMKGYKKLDDIRRNTTNKWLWEWLKE